MTVECAPTKLGPSANNASSTPPNSPCQDRAGILSEIAAPVCVCSAAKCSGICLRWFSQSSRRKMLPGLLPGNHTPNASSFVASLASARVPTRARRARLQSRRRTQKRYCRPKLGLHEKNLLSRPKGSRGVFAMSTTHPASDRAIKKQDKFLEAAM